MRFAIFILISILLLTNSCRKDPLFISGIVHVYIDYTDTNKILGYVMIENRDTIKMANYQYLDSQVFIEKRNGGFQTLWMNRLWYYFKPGEKFAYKTIDSNLEIKNNKLRSYSNQISYYTYDGDGFLNLMKGIYKILDTAGKVINEIDVKMAKFVYENGNLKSFAGCGGPCCNSSYAYSNQYFIKFGDAMMETFTGKKGNLLPVNYITGCNYGLGQSSPDYEYQFKMNDGVVIEKLETTIYHSSNYQKKRDYRSTIRYIYHYRHQ